MQKLKRTECDHLQKEQSIPEPRSKIIWYSVQIKAGLQYCFSVSQVYLFYWFQNSWDAVISVKIRQNVFIYIQTVHINSGCMKLLRSRNIDMRFTSYFSLEPFQRCPFHTQSRYYHLLTLTCPPVECSEQVFLLAWHNFACTFCYCPNLFETCCWKSICKKRVGKWSYSALFMFYMERTGKSFIIPLLALKWHHWNSVNQLFVCL